MPKFVLICYCILCYFRLFVLKKISETFDWQMLSVNLTALHIVNPEGLDAGDECLTYIEQGTVCVTTVFSPIEFSLKQMSA